MRRAALALVLAALAGCASTRADRVIGKPLELKLPKLGGGDVAVGDLKGKVLLVDVWASWCGPCVQSLPYYEDLEIALQSKGFRVLAINVDEDERAAEKFVKDTSLELTTLLDPAGQEVRKSYDIRLMPVAFFVGRDGTVRHVHEGFGPADRDKTRARLEALLAEP